MRPGGVEGHPDREYGVSFADFPGCFPGGRTVGDSAPLPTPKSLEDSLADPQWESGAIVAVGGPRPKGRAKRVSVTIDEHLLAAIDRHATAEGLTRSAYLAAAAEARIVSRLENGGKGEQAEHA